MTNKVWEKKDNNSVLNSADKKFYISFNESPCSGIPGWGSDHGGEETALCFNSSYLILNGDFREEYENVIDEGLDACKDVYNKHKNTHRSSWSED